MLRTSPRRATARPGFTLVEMLMVVAIITILLAITTVGLQKATDAQKNRSSKEQVYKLQQSLDAEYQRVVQQSADDVRGGKVPQAVKDYCDKDANRATAVWTAMQLRRQFPQSFAEVLLHIYIANRNGALVMDVTTNPSPPDSVYLLRSLATFQQVNGATTTAQNAQTDESGALLYLILAEKSASGGGAMASSADELSRLRQVPFGPKSLNTFADAFGRSLGFTRWDQSAEVQAPPYLDAKNPIKDPLDPRNLVAGWADPAKRAQMATAPPRGLLFTGQNRMANVYSLGKDMADPSDDIIGYRLRRFWKQ